MVTNKINRVSLADSYKYSHASQYPKMVAMYDYMESRGGVYPETVFVGLQYYLKAYFSKPIEQWEVDRAYKMAQSHGVSFDIDGWNYIVNELKGMLPVKIRAVKEGSLIPVKNVLMTIESTDENVPWIAGWLETILMKVWYAVNIGTKSYFVKKMLEKYGSPEWVQFAYHNFSDRGCSSVESAAICGFAHLTQFMGTDSFNSLFLCQDYYGVEGAAGFSVWASEHSTTTAHGRDGEEAFVIRMLEENPDNNIMSFVADSYDVYNFVDFCTRPGSKIREIVESRPHQKMVLRPDSGKPLEVLDKMITIMRANKLDILPHPEGKHLFKDFAILWGDGVSPEVIEEILQEAERYNFAAENFVFGSGGNLGQQHDRDTQKFAVKCSNITIEEPFGSVGDIKLTDIPVFKDPITDPGKASKKGKITTYYNSVSKKYFVATVGKDTENVKDILETVYLNGELVKSFTMDEIRNNIRGV